MRPRRAGIALAGVLACIAVLVIHGNHRHDPVSTGAVLLVTGLAMLLTYEVATDRRLGAVVASGVLVDLRALTARDAEALGSTIDDDVVAENHWGPHVRDDFVRTLRKSGLPDTMGVFDRESGHLLLMRVREAQGNVVEALRVHERLRTLLRDELGVAPGPQVQAEFERLLKAEQAAPAAEPQRREPAVDDGAQQAFGGTSDQGLPRPSDTGAIRDRFGIRVGGSAEGASHGFPAASRGAGALPAGTLLSCQREDVPRYVQRRDSQDR